MGKLHVISGDDDFTVKAHARALAAELCRGEPDEAMEIIDADPDSIKFPDLVARLLETLRTPDMFAESQYIWIRNIGVRRNGCSSRFLPRRNFCTCRYPCLHAGSLLRLLATCPV